MEFELLVVTCVVVGGVSIAGGRGTLVGVMLAVVLMTMIRPVLDFLGYRRGRREMDEGDSRLFIMLAVVSDSVFGRRRSREGRQ